MVAPRDPIGPDAKGFGVRVAALPEGRVVLSVAPFVGVLMEKVAKAPVPRPKAEEAAAFGEGMEVTRGLTLLNGLRCRCELLSPPRDLLEADGGPKTLDVGGSPDIDNESLLVLRAQKRLG